MYEVLAELEYLRERGGGPIYVEYVCTIYCVRDSESMGMCCSSPMCLG